MADIAKTILEALDTGRQIAPFSETDPGFGLDAAYAASDTVVAARVARGEQPSGWKIGFTNRAIWDQYGVRAPIWGPIYRSTTHACDPAAGVVMLDPAAYIEPLIEPEIVFRIARPPRPDMDDEALLSCIDAVGHGFEIVQSIFPGWRFTAADTVAACAMHGAFVHGPFAPVDHARKGEWIEALTAFSIVLMRDGEEIDRGAGANVLGSPLSALRLFVAGLAERPMTRGVEPGDLVTTGTVTRAFPVSAGQTWETRIEGLALPGLRLRFGDEAELAMERLIARAADARFRFENPEACASEDEYHDAVAASVKLEAEIERTLFRDVAKLAETRNDVQRRARMHARAWKASLGT